MTSEYRRLRFQTAEYTVAHAVHYEQALIGIEILDHVI
jgi:hypothetical protein